MSEQQFCGFKFPTGDLCGKPEAHRLHTGFAHDHKFQPSQCAPNGTGPCVGGCCTSCCPVHSAKREPTHEMIKAASASLSSNGIHRSAVDGNVHIEMTFGDDMRVAFSASPRKVRDLAKVMLNVCDEADADLPSI